MALAKQGEINAGVPEGTKIQSPHGTEVVVYDRDKNGKIIGWHKVLKG